MTLKIGFIGVGGIAGSYRNSLKQLNQPIAAICDLNEARAKEVAAEHGATAYADPDAMLSKEKLDAVFICIPPAAHGSQVGDAAQSGAAVFVAKPIALDLAIAEAAERAIAEAGVVNQAGYMARYSDITEKAKELVGDRPLAMGFGRFLCRMGANHPWWGKEAISGGQIVEQSTHVFDLLRYFFGEVREAHSMGHTGIASDIADFEDSTTCNLRFASGAVGNVVSTCAANAPDGFALELSGRDFYLRMVMDTQLRGNIDGQEVSFDGKETGYFRQVGEFLKAVEAKDQGLVRSSYADAKKTLAVTLAANHSLESGEVETVD